MRWILIFWGVPMGFFWGWYYLSYHDINFGLLFFSRTLHDFFFDFYGEMLGIDPETIPGLVAHACITDTVLIFSILAFRRRREIMSWWKSLTATGRAGPEAGRAPPAE